MLRSIPARDPKQLVLLEWHARHEPKYNGWRALVHAPSRTMFNRYGERLTVHHWDNALQGPRAVAANSCSKPSITK